MNYVLVPADKAVIVRPANRDWACQIRLVYSKSGVIDIFTHKANC